MIRIALASIVSPMLFPWIAWPATNTAFEGLSSGEISWDWDIANAIVNAQLFVFHGYILMFMVFIPLVFLLRRLEWTSWWIFTFSGFIFGFLCFSLALTIPLLVTQPHAIPEFFTALVEAQGGFANIFWVPEIQHYQLGSTLAAGVMMTAFWVIGVRDNSWFAN